MKLLNFMRLLYGVGEHTQKLMLYFKYVHTLGSALKLFMPRGKFASANQNDKPDLVSDVSSVLNFCICSSDVILQANSW